MTNRRPPHPIIDPQLTRLGYRLLAAVVSLVIFLALCLILRALKPPTKPAAPPPQTKLDPNMATLIAYYKSDGTCVGRCDANCYNAKRPTCDCICGGLNHGRGLDQARTNTQAIAERRTEQAKHQPPDGQPPIEFVRILNQAHDPQQLQLL